MSFFTLRSRSFSQTRRACGSTQLLAMIWKQTVLPQTTWPIFMIQIPSCLTSYLLAAPVQAGRRHLMITSLSELMKTAAHTEVFLAELRYRTVCCIFTGLCFSQVGSRSTSYLMSFRGAGASGAAGELPLCPCGTGKCPFAMQLDLDLLSFVHLHNVN